MMTEDTAALVETVSGFFAQVFDDTWNDRGMNDAAQALDALAQRLADMTENEAHAVQAFKVQEARAERAEKEVARLKERYAEEQALTRSLRESVNHEMGEVSKALTRAAHAEATLRAAPALVGPNIIGDQAWCDPFVLGAFCNAYNAWAKDARAALTEEPEYG